MTSFYTLVALFLHVKVTLQHVELYRDAKNIKIGNLLHLHGYRLNVVPIATVEFRNEMKCLTSFVKTDDCYCVNVKKQANGNVLCELLNRTMYQYPKNLTRDESSSHWFAKGLTACVPDPCVQPFATCQLKDSVSAPFACVYKTDYNFALLKPTAQASTRVSAGIFSSSHAVDGIRAMSCRIPEPACSHTNPSTEQWWRVDLQIVIPVARVVITNRKDYDNHLTDFEVKIGNSLVNEGQNNPKCGDRHAVPLGGTKTIPCSPPLPGRYVVIQSYITILIMTEVEVFAAGLEIE